MNNNIIIPQIPTPSIIDQLNAKHTKHVDLTLINDDLPKEVIVIDTSSEEKDNKDNKDKDKDVEEYKENKEKDKDKGKDKNKKKRKRKQRKIKTRINRINKKKRKPRCAALDYLSDSPKKKRGRKVKNKKNMPPIQKQPFFLVFPDLRLKCPQCDHIAICQGTLVQHLRTHRDSRKCPVCSKVFSTQQNLIKHARLHSGERPYPCPIFACKWAYKQKGDLLAHIQRGKHGTSSDNNRKPPKLKFYHGSTKLPTLHAISQKDINNEPQLKELIINLRRREETKKAQKERTKLKRKNQLDDFVLSMFLSIYDIDNEQLYKLIKVAKDKYHEKKQIIPLSSTSPILSPSPTSSPDPQNDIKYLQIDSLPKSRKANIKFNYLVNRVYGDYSIVLVPKGSVPENEIYENTPEIVIDPKLVPALNNDEDLHINHNNVLLNSINENPFIPNGIIKPPITKKRKLSNNHIQDLQDNNIVLAKGTANSNFVRTIPGIPRKRGYHKYNQTSDGYWQCDAPNCGSLFLTKERLELHCKKLHDSGYYGCKYCQRIYRSQKNVQNHLKKSHGKHGDEYLNALIYNRFHRIIRMKQSKWNQIMTKTQNKTPENEIKDIEHETVVQKGILIKTHPINHTILRYQHESEVEGLSNDNNNNTKITDKLVPWTMQEKYIKSKRGRGRPRTRINKINDKINNKINENQQSTKRIETKINKTKNNRLLENLPSKKRKIIKKRSKKTKKKLNKSKYTKKRRRRHKRKSKKELSTSPESDTNDDDDDDIDDEETETEYENSEEFSNYTESDYDYDEDNEDNEDDEDEDEDEDIEKESGSSSDEIIFKKYQIGTIHDDIDDNSSINSMDICKDEKSILALDYKLDQYLKKKQSQIMKVRQSGRKRKRNEMEKFDNNYNHINNINNNINNNMNNNMNIIANMDPICDEIKNIHNNI